jgi:hypothetical protein
MQHVVLLGDSVFDNAAYVAGAPDVIKQLRSALPGNWRATLGAVDGAKIEDLPEQLGRVPRDASHLVVSIGGNDALTDAAVLDQPARSVSDALAQIAAVQGRFRDKYRAMLDGLPRRITAVCTIYEPRFPDSTLRRNAAVALTTINDIITREAFRRDLALIDLRLVCDNDEDFANPIEPSARGGEKIAAAIARFLTGAQSSRSHVFAR